MAFREDHKVGDKGKIEKLQQYPIEKIGFETTAAQSYINQKFEEELWKNKIFTPVEVISRGKKHERIISQMYYEFIITPVPKRYGLFLCQMQDSRSNMRLVFNFPRKFVDNETGYILEKPVNYISKSDNSAITAAIDKNTSHWDKEHDINLRKQSEIC